MSNKALLHTIFNTLIAEITPQKLIADQCSLVDDTLHVQACSYDLKAYKNIYLLGSGKAVIPMAETLQALLKERITSTLIVGAYPLHVRLDNCTYIQSTHPLPSQKSLQAAQALQEAMLTCKEDDLFIYLLSGGNSALVELPETGISLEAFQEATSLMLHGGVPIEAMNAVRKHLSGVKGGKLATLSKAQGVVLVLSDVIEDDLHAIGSAPLYYDSTTFREAISQLKTYDLLEKMPQSIQDFLQEGAEGKHPETPKEEHPNITHHILGSNAIVLKKAEALLQKEAISTVLVEEAFEGYADDVAKRFLTLIRSHTAQKECYLFGGESTVKVSGEGKGGRNQHLCLSLLNQLDGAKEVTILCAATDGVDGNSNAAGALIDIHSRVNAISHRIDPKYYLETFDSNTFFSKTGEVLITGPTHNNLLDIVMILIEPQVP